MLLNIHSTAVDEGRKLLLASGFNELREGDHWAIKPNDKVLVSLYILIYTVQLLIS